MTHDPEITAITLRLIATHGDEVRNHLWERADALIAARNFAAMGVVIDIASKLEEIERGTAH
jgi:hypothetical protein